MSKHKRTPAINQPKPQSPSSPTKTTIASFQGPLPPPQFLDHYNQIVPGSAERIIKLFEVQVDHRQKMESIVITSDVRDSRLGLFLGAFISLAAIVGGVIAILYGHSTTGGIVAAIPVPTLAAVFVYGSRKRRQERDQRREP